MSCPKDDTVSQFIEGVLAHDASVAFRRHLDGCTACRALVADAAADAVPPTRVLDPLEVGSILVGKYRVLAILGAGGMGVVVSAMHEELNQKVAIKVLHGDALEDADSVKRFLREGRAAAKLRSDHAVRIYDVGRLPGGAPFLVMEHLDGQDLAAVQRARMLEVDEAVDFVLQAIEAIAEAHAHGLVHRDIKPANLFLAKLQNGETRVKVLDFGLAKELRGTSTNVDSELTTEHAFLGSPMFMSPEQIRDPRGVDKRTDVWSLGATLWQLVVGEPPFSRSSVQTTLAEVCTKTLPPASRMRPGVPRHVDDAIARCMHKDPEGRFASVEDLAAALGGLRRRSGRHAADAEAPETTLTPATAPMAREAPKFNRTVPMVATPQAMQTPRSVATVAKSPTPSPQSSMGMAITVVASLVVLGSLGAFAVVKLRGAAPAARASTVTSAPVMPPASIAPVPAEPSATATPPPAATPSAPPTVNDAPPPPRPSATTKSAPAIPTPGLKRTATTPSASGRSPEKDPYDR